MSSFQPLLVRNVISVDCATIIMKTIMLNPKIPIKMNAKKVRNYRSSKTGNTVFVYEVTGTDAELKAYKKAQGDFYREDDKTKAVLFFTTNFFGAVGTLIITAKGKVVPDMSVFDEAKSLVEQNGGNFGEVLAQGLVAQMLGAQPAPAAIEAPAAPAKADVKDATEL